MQSFTKSLPLILRIPGLRSWSRCYLDRWDYREWQDRRRISLKSDWRDCIWKRRRGCSCLIMTYVVLCPFFSFLIQLIFFFFVQGTLAPIVKVPSAAIPSEATLEALEKLSADPQNLVYIISGRDGAFLEQHLGHLKNVGFSAEHGGFFRERGSTVWTNFTKRLDMSWMSEVEEIFRYYTEVWVFLFIWIGMFLMLMLLLYFFFRGRREVILRWRRVR